MVQKRKPNWWLLYLTVPLMLGLLIVESQMHYSLLVHRMAEFAIVLLGFGLMFLWVRANQGAMIDEEIEKEPWTIQPDPAREARNRVWPPADGCDDGDEYPYSEPSATKGRYN